MAMDKKKKYKVLTCCGIGQGTCVLLSAKVKKVFEELGIKASVEPVQVSVGASQGKFYDLIFCNRNLVVNFDDAIAHGCKVIGLKNIMSTIEIKEKLLAAYEGNDKKQ